MWGRLKTAILAVVVGSAALVPLFGDPRTTPVTHPLWARMLLRAMEMDEAVRTSAEASRVFGTLAWRDSLSYPPDRYLRADGAVVSEDEGAPVIKARSAAPAEIVYPLAVVQPGDYQLRTRLSGAAGTSVSAELVSLDNGSEVKTFTLNPEPEPQWVFGGSAHLDPGAYGASVLLPPGCELSRLEVAPPCLNPIEPPEGWQPKAVTTVEDLSVTALKALDLESELPPDASPIEVRAADFQVEAPADAAEAHAMAETPEAQALRAGFNGLRAVITLDIPEPGLYSIFGFVTPGSGQRWLLDGCRKSVVCAGEGQGWRAIMTQSLSAGRHALLVSLGDGGTLDLVRVEKKKAAPSDYVATLKRVGFDPGAEGPVSPDTAIDALSFIRDKREDTLTALCGDRIVVNDLPAAPPSVIAAEMPLPPPTETVVAPEPPPQPIGPPVLPPQPPASPTAPSGT
jgi:hypothetical protein